MGSQNKAEVEGRPFQGQIVPVTIKSRKGVWWWRTTVPASWRDARCHGAARVCQDGMVAGR